ncbi:MAG TPA: NAD-dependent epimerase/dehydratase family protein, partial [Acidimicrobiales bacterium]|nr:NAD-dependent epimerase/dehydratase family protein [Acidimicrobiales bacterium]
RVEEIVGIARRRPRLERPRTTWVEADVVSAPLTELFRGADAVIHLAWLIQPSRDESVTHATNVEGSARVFDAVARAQVPALVYASSIGAYSPGPKDRPVDESWPTDGVPSSFYSRHKAAVERLLDGFEANHPDVRVVRMRKALIFKGEAAWGIRKLFLGRLIPGALLRPGRIPLVPRHPRLVFQAVHTRDVAEAYRLAVLGDARGPFNIAAPPVLHGDELARALSARAVPVPGPVMRAAADLSWRLRLQPTPAGWVDLALSVPIMETTRARQELGWRPTVDAGEALRELLEAVADGQGAPTPPLEPDPAGRQKAAA